MTYASNIRIPKYIRQALTKLGGEINSNAIIVGYLNTLYSLMNTVTRQEINKEIQDLNNIDQMDLPDIQATPLKHKWNIVQGRLHVRSQNKPLRYFT
jgi:hypothetical protein